MNLLCPVAYLLFSENILNAVIIPNLISVIGRMVEICCQQTILILFFWIIVPLYIKV